MFIGGSAYPHHSTFVQRAPRPAPPSESATESLLLTCLLAGVPILITAHLSSVLPPPSESATESLLLTCLLAGVPILITAHLSSVLPAPLNPPLNPYYLHVYWRECLSSSQRICPACSPPPSESATESLILTCLLAGVPILITAHLFSVLSLLKREKEPITHRSDTGHKSFHFTKCNKINWSLTWNIH